VLNRRGVEGALRPRAEATVPEFTGSANLVGEAEMIRPAGLNCAPLAVPGKIEFADPIETLDSQLSAKVGATGPAIYRHAPDHELRVFGEQLGDDTQNLDGRGVRRRMQPVGIATGSVREHFRLELGIGLRLCQKMVQIHDANIVWNQLFAKERKCLVCFAI
jgi:hypothetical protein